MNDQNETVDTELDDLLVPDGLPDYLGFRPRPDTIQLELAIQQSLQQMDRKVSTSNHLQAHQMLKDMILPILLAFDQRITNGERDLLEHTNNIASYLATQTPAVEGVPAELADPLIAHLQATRQLLQNVLRLLAKPEEILKALQENGDAARAWVLDPHGVIAAFMKEAQQIVQDSAELSALVNESRLEDEDEDEDEDEAAEMDAAFDTSASDEVAAGPVGAGAGDSLFEEEV